MACLRFPRAVPLSIITMLPIILASVGRPLTLAPVPLAIEVVPDEGLLFPTPLPEGVGHGHDGHPMSERVPSLVRKDYQSESSYAVMDSSRASGMRRGIMCTRPVSLRPAVDRPARPVRHRHARCLVRHLG